MNYIREYWRKIESGEIITSRRVKAVYGRLVREMDEPPDGSPWYFDEETGERPIIFVERFCKQSQGTLGATLELDLFQKAFIQTLFGWLERATGYRRFRETLFLVGRKNGKSTLLAALALYLLVADYEGAAEIYSVATKKDQAKKTLTEAVNMVKQSPELRAVLKKRRNDIYFPATASIFEGLASDSNTLDGLNSHAVIIDELHAIRDRNLYEVMKQSTSSRRQPLVIMITTSGTVRESVFDNLYGYACEVADGKTVDERFLPVLYELDERAEWTDPQKWVKANPGLGTIKQYATLADFVERAKKNPEDLPGVLCKDFNVPEVAATVWLSFEDIKSDAVFTMQDVYNTYPIGDDGFNVRLPPHTAERGRPDYLRRPALFYTAKADRPTHGAQLARGPLQDMGRAGAPHDMRRLAGGLLPRYGVVLSNAGRAQNRRFQGRIRPRPRRVLGGRNEVKRL